MTMKPEQIIIRRLRRQHGSVLCTIPLAVLDRFDLGPGDYIVFAPEEIPGAVTIRTLKEHQDHVQRIKKPENG